jgi:hypothetical protein
MRQAMPDPLNYREPGLDDPLLRQRQRTRQTLWIGAAIMCISALVMCLPLLWNGGGGKYIVAPAFIGVAMGFSILANGIIDRLRGK